MKIDLTEMMRIKGRLSDINSEMAGTFNGIGQEFESVSSNINSEGLHEAIVTIQENINNLASLFSKNMTVLEEFMGQQLSSYSVTNEEASQSLQSLISLVNQTFDQNGNVISTAAIVAYSSNKKSTNTQSSNDNVSSSSDGTAITPATSGDFVYPLANYKVTSEFGPRNISVKGASKVHKGIDLAGNPVGTPIYAVKGGTVTYAKWMNGYGNVVFVDHGDGMQTRYAHCSELDVTPGQIIEAGSAIAKVGNTGVSGGAHLHFEVRIDDTPVNPRDYFEF